MRRSEIDWFNSSLSHKRKPRDLRTLLPVLDEARLSDQVAALLTKWSGKSVTAAEGESLRAAWERELGANG